MSDCAPKLQQLLDALKKSENWFLFGVMLGVPVTQLKKIELDHQKDSDRCKLELLQYWLENTLNPTWNEIVQALEKTNQLALAAQIKHDYLWSASAAISEEESVSKPAPESSATSPATPTVASDEIKAKIEANVAVVSNLKELEASFGHMLVQVKRLLVDSKCDLFDALLFLGSFLGSEEFIGCGNFGKLIWQLQRDHISVFNISTLQQLLGCFNNRELTEAIEAYNEKKESFLKQTTILEFQRAVVSRVKPILASGKAVVTITISKEMASHRTLEDIEKLAIEGFEECHKKFISLHAEPGSIIISWVFPTGLSGRLEQLARDNAAVFEENGVVEVTVGGRRVFPCIQQEDITASQGEKEETKSKLKQLYTKFYPQLVEAVSDPDACHSLTTQLHSTSLLSEEKKAMLSQASGSSYLEVLRVEEEPHLLTVLMEKMSTVKPLQTLSEDMTTWLSGSKQAADTNFTEEQGLYYERKVRQQLETDIERLTSDRADLRSKLQCCEKYLKEVYELSKLREKTISGMMAAAAGREKDERITHLTKTDTAASLDTTTATSAQVIVSEKYRKDYEDIQDRFAQLFDEVGELLENEESVTLESLKKYLSKIPEMRHLLDNAYTISDIIDIIQEHSSFTCCSHLKGVARRFNVPVAIEKIEKYHQFMNQFCQNELTHHIYMKPFLTSKSTNFTPSTTITFKLRWRPAKKTLSDIQNLLQQAFDEQSVYVHIVVVRGGSVRVICCAPQYLMTELVRLAQKNKELLVKSSVTYLRVGDTVIVDSCTQNEISLVEDLVLQLRDFQHKLSGPDSQAGDAKKNIGHSSVITLNQPNSMMAGKSDVCTGASLCERQFFDSSRVPCCYFCSTDASVSEAGDRSVRGQGILIQLSNNTVDSQLEQQLVVLTSHQLVPSLSSARGWVIGFGGSKKEFSLNDYVDQKQLRVITCCGPDGDCLWDNQKSHPVSSCPMRGGCSVLLLGTDFTQEVLAEIGTSMEMFTTDHIMHLEAAQKVLLGGPAVIVCHRNKTTVLPSSFQISKPPAVDFSLLSSHMDWYHKHYTMFDYLLDSALLYYTGAPIIYCEPNTGKPWLLGMHVYLESQSVQYGVSVGHIFELLQCSLFLSSCGAPQCHVPKLSLLNQAVQKNICAPRYYDNIRFFWDNFGFASLELTDLLQISHCLANKHLLFAQSESFYDDIEIRQASLLLLEALSKLFKKFDPEVITATVDGVEDWCHSLTTEDVQKGFSDLCQQLAFSILPDQNKEEIVQNWFNCWSNLVSLNGLITDPIMQCQLLPTFQRCQALYPNNVCVQRCFGKMMAACLIFTTATQFHKLSTFETQQVARDKERWEIRQTILELKEKAQLYDVEREAQQQEPPSAGQSTEVLVRKIIEQERTILFLQSLLEASEKDRRELQEFLQQRYVFQAAPK